MTDPTSPGEHKRNLPKAHRFLLYLSAVVLTILLLWLWSFLLADIGAVTQPNYQKIEQQIVSRELLAQHSALKQQIADVTEKIDDLQKSQELLRDSTNNARETMNQLLENQRQLAEKDIQLSPAEQEAIAQSQRLFLENQAQYQQLNEQIVAETNELRSLRKQIEAVEKQIEPMREKAQREYDKQLQSARMKAAVIKLSFLLPLMFVALWLLLRKRKTTYGILVYPFVVSVFLKTVEVVHHYFPTRYFKYIGLVALILAVSALIVYLVKMMAKPRRDFLLKQFREAYDRKICPTCAYPVRRGVLKDLPTGGRSAGIVALSPGATEPNPEPYTCPSCGERLFEKCEHCQHIRHSLLPYCETCGAEKVTPVAG